jgi:hypothetical protein
MSDDLVKQSIAELQDLVRCRCQPVFMHGPDCNCDTADAVQTVADRIEELEADNKGLRHMILDQINSTGDGPEIMAATRVEWAARALAAEAKLARSVEGLEAISSDMCEPRDDASAFLTCQSILAELKGGSDD